LSIYRSPARASSRTTRRASSKLPSTVTTLAPKNMAWASLPSATLPDGRMTTHRSPALAA